MHSCQNQQEMQMQIVIFLQPCLWFLKLEDSAEEFPWEHCSIPNISHLRCLESVLHMTKGHHSRLLCRKLCNSLWRKAGQMLDWYKIM